MKNNIIKITKTTCLTLIAAALVAAPAISRAADSTNAPAAQAPAKKAHGQPYHGKVASVDANAMTFTVGKTTIGIASTTKITKDGKPAVFSDITEGEYVTGSYKKGEDGKVTASSVKIGTPKKKGASAAPADASAASGK